MIECVAVIQAAQLIFFVALTRRLMIPALFRFFSSIKLTVCLLSFSLILVFLATLDQVNWGIRYVQRHYFERFVTLWHYPEQWLGSDYLEWMRFVLPGGYLLGSLLLINLIAAHVQHFRLKRSHAGISILHLGVILLLVSGFLTSVFQQESQIWLSEGFAKHFSEESDQSEWALVDTTRPDQETHYVNAFETLEQGQDALAGSGLPFRALVQQRYENAELIPLESPLDPSMKRRGIGAELNLHILEKEPTYKEGAMNTRVALVELLDASSGRSLGTWVLSNLFDENFPKQSFEHEGRTYTMSLRHKRTYFPYWIELLAFTRTLYPGTQVPQYFSSQLKIHEESGGVQKALIEMNAPLRRGPYSFYQASYNAEDAQKSMLQVVYNPTRTLPYVSLLLIFIGLVLHFILKLNTFLSRRPEPWIRKGVSDGQGL